MVLPLWWLFCWWQSWWHFTPVNECQQRSFWRRPLSWMVVYLRVMFTPILHQDTRSIQNTCRRMVMLMKQRVSVCLPAILNAWCVSEMIRPKNDKPSTVIIIIKVVRGTINAHKSSSVTSAGRSDKTKQHESSPRWDERRTIMRSDNDDGAVCSVVWWRWWCKGDVFVCPTDVAFIVVSRKKHHAEDCNGIYHRDSSNCQLIYDMLSQLCRLQINHTQVVGKERGWRGWSLTRWRCSCWSCRRLICMWWYVNSVNGIFTRYFMISP